ncbi:MAG: protein kinase [Myxococcales bacterium]|nr:protein kinase [Myxococcales bacterium]
MAADSLGQEPTVLASGVPLVDGEVIAAGTHAGDYVIERTIGAGGMGEVYAGRHPVIGKRVAIKVLRRDLASRPESAERFLREARAVNQVDHPNVVDVFALGRLADGRLYLVMDLLDGESLRATLAAGALPAARALVILEQVAAALDAAHDKGVIHRDLKPDNIVLTGPSDRPTAHVLDFGIAKLVADAQGDAVATLTGQGAWLGTPAYMAPEQWTADGATAASDRYALGVLAFELITGKAPFHAPSLPAMMEQHFRAAVPSVTTAAGAALPAGLDRVFARALAKEPSARPASARLLVEELAAALAGRGVVASRGRARWIGGAGAAVLLAGGAVLVLGRDAARPPGGAPAPAPKPVITAGVAIVTSPAGAIVTRGGQRVGETPVTVPAATGETVAIELSLPGYVAVARQLTVGDGPAELRVDLARASGFDGVWRLPEGELRAFERRDDQVAGFRLRAPGDPREFLRFFTFAPARPGAVAFTATEPFVVEEAPDEPSCNIPLRAEYVYRPADDQLEVRRERAKYTVAGGRCTLEATAWSEPRPLVRIAAASTDGAWAESRAGAAAPVAAVVIGGDQAGNGDSANRPPSVGDAKPAPKPQRKPVVSAAARGKPTAIKPEPNQAKANVPTSVAPLQAPSQAQPPAPQDDNNIQGDGPIQAQVPAQMPDPEQKQAPVRK